MEEKNKDSIQKYELFLANIQGIGAGTIQKLLEICDNAYNLYHMTDKEIQLLDVLKEKQKANLIYTKSSWDLDKELEKIYKKKINIIGWEEEAYPQRLRKIDNPPYLLYYYGKLPDEKQPSVAIVGARMCSEYGKHCAKLYGKELAKRGVQIISGMASGIDSIAQASAMDAGGRTFGILGNGVDVCYPSTSRAIYQQMKVNGGIISEFEPGEMPEASHFPMRNRIISGLADLVLVIEAKERSGTAITVNMALEQGKDVYAVPGRIDDALSVGCNRLIKDGAGMACCVNDILLGLGYGSNDCQREGELETTEQLSPEEHMIYHYLKQQAMSAEELFQKMKDKNVSIQELLGTLLLMEIKDVVECNAGKYSVK